MVGMTSGENLWRGRAVGRLTSPLRPGRLPPPDKAIRNSPFAAAKALKSAAADPPLQPQAGSEAQLERAQRLADEGDMEAAAGLCRDCLRRDQGNAQAYYLLGLINQAAGKLHEAEECLDKTLYLDPKHREALIHRSLIAADQGDHGIAERLMERAEKCA